MHIIAGRHRGRTLKTPKGFDTRPVLGKVREALFNALGDLNGIRVLDLFAGTGAVGIEALSRGAVSLTAVEAGAAQCRIIGDNLAMLGESADIVRTDVFRALKRLCESGRMYDLVFADPPYETGLSQRTVLAVLASDMVARPGLLAVTVRRREVLPGDPDWTGDALPDGCAIVFDRRYGDTRLVVYRTMADGA